MTTSWSSSLFFWFMIDSSLPVLRDHRGTARSAYWPGDRTGRFDHQPNYESCAASIN